MAALIGSNGNGLHIFLDRTINYLLDGSIVPKMNNFHSGALNDTSHNINGRIVTVKQGSCGDDPDMILGLIGCELIEGDETYFNIPLKLRFSTVIRNNL